MEKETAVVETVKLECLGIVNRMGFNAYPSEGTAVYLEFLPDVPQEVEKSVADYLLKASPNRFKVIGAAVAPKQEQKEEVNNGKNNWKKRPG